MSNSIHINDTYIINDYKYWYKVSLYTQPSIINNYHIVLLFATINDGVLLISDDNEFVIINNEKRKVSRIHKKLH